MRWTSISARAVGRQPAGADGLARRVEHQFHRSCRRWPCCRMTTGSSAVRPTCSSWRWRATASRSCRMASRSTWETAAVIWGEPGNNAPAFVLPAAAPGHQRAALDFLLPVNSSCGDQAHQNLAIANCLAQAEALVNGQSAETVRADLAAPGYAARRASTARPAQGAPRQPPEHHRAVPAAGSRPRWASSSRSTSTRCSRRAWSGASTPSTSGAWSWARSWPSSSPRR